VVHPRMTLNMLSIFSFHSQADSESLHASRIQATLDAN
jgi:hypothetical protein